MSLRALALDWSLDGPTGAAFLAVLVALGGGYLAAVRHGNRCDRRGRRWPRHRTACFLAGIAVLAVDLYSGIGSEADVRVSVHMIEHMIMWIVVAPLLAGGAPVRLAFYALSRRGRRVLGRCLRHPALAALAGPVGSVSLFSTVLLAAHLPAIYELALSNDYVHELEHGLFLLTSLLVWAPLLGVDPLPHRAGPLGQLVCMSMCMVPMALVAVWLGSVSHPVYGHYADMLGPSALHDQHVAALIMWVCGLPAFGVPALARRRLGWRLRLREAT